MLPFYIVFLLLPLLRPIFATPSLASSVKSIFKRDDCHGSQLCSEGGSQTPAKAVGQYNTPANAPTYYYDYTSYTANAFTVIYVCPKGKYPGNVTGAQIYAAAQQINGAPNFCNECGTHWVNDSDGHNDCRVTINYCSSCKNVVNGKDGNGPGSPTPVPPVAPAPPPKPNNTPDIGGEPVGAAPAGGAAKPPAGIKALVTIAVPVRNNASMSDLDGLNLAVGNDDGIAKD
ncbi:hypothetical protein MMC18_001778 [Xylographa bjoerkii]|nr:hypothetical protein [Xylographa bjoerkii]